jgi:apolipoprotein N-acyltransferase
LRVAAIQGNTPSSTHHLRTEAEMIRLYGGLSRDAAAKGAALILWPETAVAFPLRPGKRLLHGRGGPCRTDGGAFRRGGF